jgi:hypothetical protein
MPGRPMHNKLLSDIAARGGWDPILDAIADGRTIASLAAEYGVSRSFFSTVLHLDDARSAAVKAARVMSADALAEAVVDIADQTTAQTERADRLRVDTKRWLAARRNPEVYGERVAPLVQINAGQLHLSALQQVEMAREARLTGGRDTNTATVHARESEVPHLLEPVAVEVVDVGLV